MITLNVFGPHFGLPDGSPFCIKALTLLKMSGLPFEEKRMNFKEAPKGKAPYLREGDKVIADSHFIVQYLEVKHGIDFSGGYGAADLAKGWAVARMMEEHFYFLSMNIRWLNDENFWKGPYQFFAEVPAPIRPLIARIVRKKVRKTHDLQGLGRHTPEERLGLAEGDLNAIEAMLGKNKYLLGNTVSGADATAFAFIWAGACRYFNSPIGDYIRTRPVLMAYLARMRDVYFPGFGTVSRFSEAIAAYSPRVRVRLKELRQLVLDTAAKTDGVGKIEEALRWNQPSFLTPETGSGSTIRIDGLRNDPEKLALYFHCQSGLIDEFKLHYGSALAFEGNRAIILDAKADLPSEILKHCISLALTHHLRKKLGRK